MKNLLIVLYLIFQLMVLKSQTFSNAIGGAIPDNNTEVCFPIVVSGLPQQINSGYGLTAVCVNINHTYDAQLKVKLKSNNGFEILLVNNNGGNGDNFFITCFAQNGVNGAIGLGAAPFTGTYIPFQSINLMNNNQNPNGTWYVCIKDEVPLDSGALISSSLFFSFNPPPDTVNNANAPCSVANGSACFCPDGTQDCDLLPDMTASEMAIQNEHTEFPGRLTLTNATPNIGWGPIEVHGSNSCFCDTVSVPCTTTICPGGGTPKQKLLQTIYHKNGSTITSKDTLTKSAMASHPTHGHIHIDDWSEFTLRKATNNPDATTWPIVSKGSKVSFCLVNLGDCQSSYGYCKDGNYGNVLGMGDIPNAPFGMVTGCGTDQGIYVGNYDVYDQSLPDMFIDLSGVCNGDYYIVSVTDPHNYFIESDETNNWTAVPITLTKQIPKPKAEFTYTIMQGSLVQFNNKPSILYDFYWNFGDGATSNFQNPTHLYSQNGEYEVTLILKSDCGNDTIKQKIIIDNPSHYSVFPNPLVDNLNINYTLTENSDVVFEIYSSLGQQIFIQQEQKKDAGNYEFKLNTNELDLKPGVFILYLKLQNQTQTIRLVKL